MLVLVSVALSTFSRALGTHSGALPAAGTVTWGKTHCSQLDRKMAGAVNTATEEPRIVSRGSNYI